MERPDDPGQPASDHRPAFWSTLRRGARRRCPHCGRGPLFVRWITSHERCRDCGLVYVQNQGDTWLYWIVMDRIPIALGIILIYFGFRVSEWRTGLVFFLAMAVPLVVTMPHRQGVAIALNYLSRIYFRDPSDEIPPPCPPGDTVTQTEDTSEQD